MSASESKKDSIHLHKFAASEPAEGTPQDLGQTEFIKRSAAETLEDSAASSELETAEFGLPVKEMLGVIAYCYVKGVFCSPDIAALLKSDPALRAKFGRQLPDGVTVRRFRRRYAAEIEDVLEDVMRAYPEANQPAEKQTEFIQRQAGDLLHNAVRTDNNRSGLV